MAINTQGPVRRVPMGQSGFPTTIKKYLERPLSINIAGVEVLFDKVNENGTLYPAAKGTIATDAVAINGAGQQVQISMTTVNGSVYFKVHQLDGLGALVEAKGQVAGNKLF